MNYIEQHINHIKGIQQVNFSLTKELEIAINIENSHNNDFIKSLALKLNNNDIDLTNRSDIIHWANNNSFSDKELTVIIFCWGSYFSIMRKNPNTLKNFLRFSNDKDEDFFSVIRSRIFSLQWNNNKIIEDIFKSHLIGDAKIPGIDYPFFTKLFFFFSPDNRLPILDKCLLKSFVYLIQHDDNITHKSFSINKNFTLGSNKHKTYSYYVQYLNAIAESHNITINDLETFLFGWRLNIKKSPFPYENPRIIYNAHLS